MTRPTDATKIPDGWTTEDIERERAAVERRLNAVLTRVYAMVILRKAAELDEQEALVAA